MVSAGCVLTLATSKPSLAWSLLLTRCIIAGSCPKLFQQVQLTPEVSLAVSPLWLPRMSSRSYQVYASQVTAPQLFQQGSQLTPEVSAGCVSALAAEDVLQVFLRLGLQELRHGKEEVAQWLLRYRLNYS